MLLFEIFDEKTERNGQFRSRVALVRGTLSITSTVLMAFRSLSGAYAGLYLPRFHFSLPRSSRVIRKPSAASIPIRT